MGKDRIDELAWKAFEKSGHAGTYMLYRAIKEQEKNDEE